MDFRARHHQSGRWVEVATSGGRIAAVDAVDGTDVLDPADIWVGPAFWDIQVNGRWGVSFSDPGLTVAQVAAIVRGQASLGTARLCPTLISAPASDTLHGVRAIARACESLPEVAARVPGIHLEGPWISGLDGYRGAHPAGSIRDPDWREFEAIRAASGGRIALVTLAPERPGAIEFIARLASLGVVVALGHTAADAPTIDAAVEAGATLSTHLGNGIASPLARHPNPIWDQAAHDGLSASFIADGHHLPPGVLRALVRAKTAGRVILVGDASPLAGLPPGIHGDWEILASGKIVVAGTNYLAGSSRGIEAGVAGLIRDVPLGPALALAAATAHPARLLGRAAPAIAVGEPANLIRYRLGGGGDGPSFELIDTCVDGDWTGPESTILPPF